jgi:hypothetical protein
MSKSKNKLFASHSPHSTFVLNPQLSFMGGTIAAEIIYICKKELTEQRTKILQRNRVAVSQPINAQNAVPDETVS